MGWWRRRAALARHRTRRVNATVVYAPSAPKTGPVAGRPGAGQGHRRRRTGWCPVTGHTLSATTVRVSLTKAWKDNESEMRADNKSGSSPDRVGDYCALQVSSPKGSKDNKRETAGITTVIVLRRGRRGSSMVRKNASFNYKHDLSVRQRAYRRAERSLSLFLVSLLALLPSECVVLRFSSVSS